MGAPFDFFQGINKGFWAGGAGAPVDTLTLALNALIAGGGYAGHKMGLLNTPPGLIEKPVGGSEWIADKMRGGGLLNDNPGSTADNFGNVIGGLLGPVTAAKAPQIARGLLQGGKNLAAPRTLNPQTGAVVWHGSPHKFDKFDSSKIGTGEGNQSYGHGLYFAENPSVSKAYSDGTNGIHIGGKRFDVAIRSVSEDPTNALKWKLVDQGLPEKQASLLSHSFESNDPASRLLELASKNSHNEYGEMAKKLHDEIDFGNFYKVDLPDEHIAKMLDWDKPLSKQSKEVQRAIAKTKTMLPPNAIDDLGGDLSLMYGPDVTPKDFLNTWESFGQKAGGENALQKLGVPGVRYLDGGSRGVGQGTSNFVVFPGNEGLLSILERNGIPIK